MRTASLPPMPTETAPVPPMPSPSAAVLRELQDAQKELQQTRSVVAAARLRSCLRTRRALALSNSWATWQQASLTSAASSVAEPLLRELTVMREEVSASRDRGQVIRELRKQINEAREADEELQRRRDEQSRLEEVERKRLERALAESQSALAESQSEVAALREEIDHAAATLREGFAEAATQGARLAAEEHGRQMITGRLRALLYAAEATRLTAALHGWACSARAIGVDDERRRLLKRDADLAHETHLARRKLDSTTAELARFRATSEARERELQREASALRSALLAAAPAPSWS